MLVPLLAIIFAVPFGMHICFTPPTSAAPKERRLSSDWSKGLALCASMYIYSCWAHAAIEVLILTLPLVAHWLPDSPIIQWMNNTLPPLILSSSTREKANILYFPPLRVLGASLAIAGSTFRYMCFRELGRYFTFNVAILENHRLVTTGPYSIVRHPSYTSAMLSYLGIMLWHGTSGSWLVESKFYTHMIAWITLLPTVIFLGRTIIMATITRPKMEDEALEKEFGKQWREWAKRVPYRIIPGIY